MSTPRFAPPVEYLRAASRASLQSFELARLNHAANLRREMAALMDQWINEMSDAAVARWMIEHHQSLSENSPAASETLSTFPDVSADPVSDPTEPATDVRGAPPRLCASRRQIGSALGRKTAR